ncbi:hypothetical protein [Micromonospora echinospora]|uniref:hypothetical protein n=2 Tax=Micromonospora echinospora TaxID=1877 RepID=UPI003A87BD4C
MLAAGGAVGGIAGIITTLVGGMLQRPKVRADAVALLTDSALKQVNELQERTAEAEREATATRNELAQARQKIRELTADIDWAMGTMRTWRAAILSDSVDRERLRAMVLTDQGGVNGRHFN